MDDRASAAHGLTALYMDPGWFGDEAGAVQFGEVMRDARIEYFGLADPDLAADPDAWGATDMAAQRGARDAMSYRLTETATGWSGGSDFQRCVRAMEIAAAAGATIVTWSIARPGCAIDSSRTRRWRSRSTR